MIAFLLLLLAAAAAALGGVAALPLVVVLVGVAIIVSLSRIERALRLRSGR